MSQLNDREQAFEQKYAKDQELQFKVQARRNKLLGIWAAKHMGMNEAEMDEYAKSVVISDFEEPGDDDVLRKVLADLQNFGMKIEANQLRYEMDILMRQAMDEIMKEVNL